MTGSDRSAVWVLLVATAVGCQRHIEQTERDAARQATDAFVVLPSDTAPAADAPMGDTASPTASRDTAYPGSDPNPPSDPRAVVDVAPADSAREGATADQNEDVPPARLVALTIKPLSAVRLVGETFPFVASAVTAEGAEVIVTAEASWASLDPTVVAVTSGQAHCLMGGTGTVVVTAQGLAAHVALVCLPSHVVGLAIAPAATTLPQGARQPFAALVTFADGSSQDMTAHTTWGTANVAVATISNAPDDRGSVSAVAPGMTQVVAVFDGLNATAKVTVGDTQLAAHITRGPYLQMGRPQGAAVHWRTDAAVGGWIRYGTAADQLTLVADDPVNGFDHVVNLTGLAPATLYHYAVGSGATALLDDATTFFVTPPGADMAKAQRIWVVGDSGTGSSVAAGVFAAYQKFGGQTHTDVWLMLGDNAYWSGHEQEYETGLFDMYQPLLQHTFLWPALGNHDTDQAVAPAEDVPYFQAFDLPRQAEIGGMPSGTEHYYSFDQGNIHFVSLDSMTSGRRPGSAMLTWLDADLSANTKNWTIAYWHHAPYTKGSHDSDVEPELVEMRHYVLPILEGHGVDLVLCGHSHSYERSVLLDGHYGESVSLTPAMKKNAGSGRPDDLGGPYTKHRGVNAHEGTVYVVAGSSGGQVGFGALNHPAMFVSSLAPGSLVLDVDGDRLVGQFLLDSGIIFDSFAIVKAP